jgi:hypothetical protein
MASFKRSLLILSPWLGLCLLAACDGSSDSDDLNLDGTLEPMVDGKDDGPGQPAIAVDADVSDTEVWKVRNHWEDTNTAEARAAGMAWPANSGLTWDQKYSAWVGAMRKVQSQDGNNNDTYELLTPYGKTAPSPSLECAETAMFLRATFAAWYGLPFFMEAYDRNSGRIFVGHFGARTAQGRWNNSPRFSQYKDYTGSWNPGDSWPTDAKLQTIRLHDQNSSDSADEQLAIGPGTHLGAYLDTIFINKRAGYFVAYLLDFFFSGNVADSVNTYNLQPTAMREGDVVLHRTNHNDIGHTLVIKHVEPYGDSQILVEMVSGYMPRRQGNWANNTASKLELTSDEAGGSADSSDNPPVPMWKDGGGLKRWRVARAVGGAWVNTFMPGDNANWISANDGTQLSARPMFFQSYIADLPPEQQRDAYLGVIADARAKLMRDPSSCAQRSIRERAFNFMVALAGQLNSTPADMERMYRTLDDGVFAELDYPSSKVCCWDHSSPSMGKIVMDYATEEQANFASSGMCKTPTVFRANSIVPQGYDGPIDGFQLWRDWAAKKGRSGEWVDSDGKPAVWQKDEPCQGAASTDDKLAFTIADYCSLIQPSPDPGSSPDMGQ